MSPRDFHNTDKEKYSPNDSPKPRSRASSVDTEGSSEEGVFPETLEDVEPERLTVNVPLMTHSDAVGNAVSLKRGRDDEPVPLSVESVQVGVQYDVLDSKNTWCEGEILKINREEKCVFVTFTFWSSKFDTWIDNVPERIAPLHTHTYTDNGILKTGQRVEVLDEKQKWLEAFVIEETDTQVKIHYKGFHAKFDEWIDRDRSYTRIQPFGRARHPFIPHMQWSARNFVQTMPGNTYELLSGYTDKENHSPTVHTHTTQTPRVRYIDNADERQRKIATDSLPFLHYKASLELMSLSLVEVRGDGNCLFRAVSQQIYGDEAFHAVVRAKCMDYMESESAFFSQFVVGGASTFSLYLEAKRRDACWGDDPEIEALCEIYDRAAEIWTYDKDVGAKKLRTFHENVHALARRGESYLSTSTSSSSSSSSALCERERQRERERERAQRPMRLSYYGGGHYDSIVEKDLLFQGRDRRAPGEIEDDAIARSRRRIERERELARERRTHTTHTGGSSAEREREQAQLDAALRESRRLAMLAEHDDLETSLLLSLRDSTALGARERVAEKETERETEIDAGRDAALLAATQEAMLERVQQQSEREFIERALVDSLSTQTAQATQVPGEIEDTHTTQVDRDVQLALELSQLSSEEALQLALQQSISTHTAHTETPHAAAAAAMSEDEMLQLALAESLKAVPPAEPSFAALGYLDEGEDEELMLAIMESLKK